MQTVVIIQARIKSSRLPGKVLKNLANRTVLSHVLERCAAIEDIDAICCATVPGIDGDGIAKEAERCGVSVYQGSEDDVLDRYYQAAKYHKADLIIRITSDCPLIDPKICNDVLKLRNQTDADYACNNMPASWPHGLDCEVITFDWLERSAQEAKRPSEREHVTQYIRNHPDAKKVNHSGPRTDLNHHRWTLDTKTDLEFLQSVYKRLPGGKDGWGWEAVMSIVESDKELVKINAGQDRYEGLKKSLIEDIDAGFTGRDIN